MKLDSSWKLTVCLHFICLSFTNSFITSFDKERFSQQKFLAFAGEVITLSPLFFPATTSFPLKVQGSAFSPCICVRSYTRKCRYLLTKSVRILTLLIIYLQTYFHSHIVILTNTGAKIVCPGSLMHNTGWETPIIQSSSCLWGTSPAQQNHFWTFEPFGFHSCSEVGLFFRILPALVSINHRQCCHLIILFLLETDPFTVCFDGGLPRNGVGDVACCNLGAITLIA